jgi:FkbM family methyltransferase
LIIEPQPKGIERLARSDFPTENFSRARSRTSRTDGVLHGRAKCEGDGPSLFQRLDTVYAGVSQQIVRVPVRALDEIIDETGIQTVDFMKMDIEGAELLALRGAESSLRRGKTTSALI